MITKVNAYQSSDGTAHSSLEEAQRHELKNLLAEKIGWVIGSEDLDKATTAVIKNAEAIIDILTTTPNSKPKARKINGGTKKRKKGEQLQTEPLPLVAAEEVKK